MAESHVCCSSCSGVVAFDRQTYSLVLPHKSKSHGGNSVGPECTVMKYGGLYCYTVERYDGTKERFWRESCGTVFTHLVTIFRVEFLWGCFVHFVSFAGDVVPVGCARISVLLLLLLLLLLYYIWSFVECFECC